jgi:transposase
VENALCAFSKELVDAIFASTAPAASADVNNRDLGHSVGSALAGLRLEAPAEDSHPDRMDRDGHPVGSRATSASTRGMQVTGGRVGGDAVTEPCRWFLGIDWGSEEHQFCLTDEAGRICDQRAVAHTTIAIYGALEAVRARTGTTAAEIAVGIEMTRGVLVETVLEQGFRVFAVNPKQLDRFRDRFSAGGAKDDRRDAHVLSDALRTDARAFRALRPDDPALVPLRELSRLLEDLQVDEGRLINRLREQLYRVHAPWLLLSPAAADPWLWDVLQDAPHPDAWPTLARRRIAPILRAHRIRRVTVDGVVAALGQPTLTSAPGVADAVALRVAAVIPQLRLVHEQRTHTERQIDRLLADLAASESGEGPPTEHRDAEILLSLPGVGRVVAAAVLTEASGPLADRDYSTLRAYTGAAPITKRSGKRLFIVRMRYACKARLRQALYHWSRTSLQHDAAARAYYDRLRARGHAHGRALRSVGDRWLRILIGMLNSRTLYDASRFDETQAQPA